MEHQLLFCDSAVPRRGYEDSIRAGRVSVSDLGGVRGVVHIPFYCEGCYWAERADSKDSRDESSRANWK